MTCEALRALQLRPEKPHQERTGNEERGYSDHQKAPEDACRTALIDHVAKEYGEDRVEESCRTQLIHMVILVGGARWRQSLAPAVGFEPTTWRLTAARSTTELRRNMRQSTAELRFYQAWLAIFLPSAPLLHVGKLLKFAAT